MSFFYKYVKLSDNKKDDSVIPDNNDESTALIPEDENSKNYAAETGTDDKDKFNDDSDNTESGLWYIFLLKFCVFAFKFIVIVILIPFASQL